MPDPMPLPAGPHRTEIRPAASSGVAMLFVVVVVVATLYFAREILVPFALAALLSFVLAPLVTRLRRLRVPRVAAVLVAVVLAFAVILGAGAMLAGQVTSLATNLPQYQSNISAKIQSLRGASPGGVIERASSMLKDLGDEISKTDDATQPNGPLGRVDRQKPLPVEIRQPDPAPFQIVQNIIGPLLHPLATTGVVLVFVIFILLQREDLRDRLIRLAGARDLHRTTQALDDAGERVSRYLLMQLVINACFGLLIGIGLWVIGVPNPVLWGVTAMLLRFVPFIGAFIAAALPFALAVAVAPGWSMALWTLALFVVVEPVVSQVVEPLLYGTSTGLSSIAVVLSAIFWTWLWGPVGLLLSMPLTVCLVVLGRHVPQLHFFDVLLGNRAVLAPEESFYQRLLAGDPDEASENVETFLKERPLSAYYDEVALRALGLAQSDLRRGALDDDRRQRIKDSLDGVFDNLSEHGDQPVDGNTSDAVAPMLMPERLAPEWQGQPVLCAAGKTVLDEGAAALLAQLLERHGLGARVAPCETVAASRLGQLDGAATRLVCLSYLDPDGQTHARFVVRRLRRRLPQARIVVGFWTVTEEEAARRDLLAATGADAVVYTLRQAVSTIIEAAQATVPHHAAAE